MSEDYRKGYRDGFDDGYEKGKRDALKQPLNPVWPNVWGQPKMQYEPRCPVCGIRWDKSTGYVCMRDNCPSKITHGIGDAQTNDTGC